MWRDEGNVVRIVLNINMKVRGGDQRRDGCLVKRMKCVRRKWIDITVNKD